MPLSKDKGIFFRFGHRFGPNKNLRQFMALGPRQNPQLACREIPTHANCMISKIDQNTKLLIYNDFLFVSKLAQRSQYIQ